MGLPRLVVTGASGFVGRHLLEALKERWQVFGLARRSQVRSGAPVHPNITWYQADIGEREALSPIFAEIRRGGGVDVLFHLAAHYDFTGDEDPEYQRTNVDGLRNVLELSQGLGLKRFVFSSSVAACKLPPPGGKLDESSPADGEHIYARTKRIGEAMLREYPELPSTVVRCAAMFSDWCEYPPLYMFLETWLSGVWNRRILGGKGLSAIPYLHVHDATLFFVTLLEHLSTLPPGELVIASPDGCTSHRELFEAATLLHHGQRSRPVLMPRLLCGPGMLARDLLGRLLGERPFERPWMARYIDTRMTIDASRTRSLLGWAPRERLEVLRRLPFLVENRRLEPHQWNTLNRAAMKQVQLRSNLRIHRLLERHEDGIIEEFHAWMVGPEGERRFPNYQALSEEEQLWNDRAFLRNLMNAVRTRDKGVFVSYARDLAERRFHQGYEAHEICESIEELNRICFKHVRRDPESEGLHRDLQDHVTITLRSGCDEAQDVFEMLAAAGAPR
jgi:nucleoside-diphosphate-sugar epimerase